MISTPIQPRPCKRRGPDCCAACCCPTAAGTAFTPYEHEPLCVECWHKLSRLERSRIFLLGVAWTLAPVPLRRGRCARANSVRGRRRGRRGDGVERRMTRRPTTLQQDLAGLRLAWLDFVRVVARELRIGRAADWLARQLRRMERRL